MNSFGIGYEYAYYRTGGGAEVDLVVEADFGCVAVEVKRTSAPTVRDLRPLRDFVHERKLRLGIVVNTDVVPRLYEDRIIGLPFNWL